MEKDKSFYKYYLQYLGVNELELKGTLIKECKQREIPVSNWHYQHLILTKINNTFIYSIEPKLCEDFKNHMLPCLLSENGELIKSLHDFFEKKINDYSIKKMYRLSIDKEKINDIKHTKSVVLTKNILMANLQDLSCQEKDVIWNRKKKEIEQGRQFTILEKGKITCWCKVSNIDYGAGNLAVWTTPDHRRKGYGKDVVRHAVKWCFNNNVIPIYLVDSLNIASINLAKSLGFKIKSEEIVVTTTKVY